MDTKRIYVVRRPSKIAGTGAFAVSNIQPGQKFSVRNVSVLTAGGINHSCKPNTKIILIKVGRRTKNNGLIALRRIRSGEELTVNYFSGEPAPRIFNCNCYDCRTKKL